MLAAAQPLEGHHLRGHQFGTRAGQAIEGSIAVALGARAAGIGDDPDFELVFQQFQRLLQQSDMGFAAGYHAGLSLVPPHSALPQQNPN